MHENQQFTCPNQELGYWCLLLLILILLLPPSPSTVAFVGTSLIGTERLYHCCRYRVGVTKWSLIGKWNFA